MAITAVINSTFTHLVDDRTLMVKQNVASREREAVVDITVGAGDNYVTGGITVDFSVVRGFSRVYSCEIIQSTTGRDCSFIPATGNAAATGKIKIWHTDGTELSSENSLTNSKTFRVIIRGI